MGSITNTSVRKIILVVFIFYFCGVFISQSYSIQENVVKLDTLKNEAKQLIAEKKYEEAIKIYEQIKKDFPQEAIEVEINIARCFFWQENYDKAILLLQETADKYSDKEDVTKAILLMAEIYHFRAIKVYEQVKAENLSDKEEEIITKLLQSDDSHGYKVNLEKAIGCLEKMISDYPSSEDIGYAMYSLGIFYAEEKQYVKALKTLEMLAKNYPDNKATFDAQLAISKIYEMQKEYDKSIAHYQEIVSKISDPKHIAEVDKEIGECYFKKGDYKLALKYLSMAIDKTTKHGLSDSAYVLRGKVYESMKEYDKAIGEYQKVSPYDPHWIAEANFGIASCYFVQGKKELALEHLTIASSKAKNLTLKTAIQKKMDQIQKVKP